MTATMTNRAGGNSSGIVTFVQKQVKEFFPPILALTVFLILWELFARIPGATLPGPIQVITDSFTLRGGVRLIDPFFDKGGLNKGLFWQVLASLQRVAIGYTMAAIAGIALGILIGINNFMFKALDPIFQVLRTVPPLAWLPISLAALRQNEPAALFVIFITAIWPILINTAVGVKQIPQDYINVSKVLQLSKTEFFFKVLFPSAVPYIFTGLRIGIGLSWLAIIAAEIVMSGVVGIGFFIWDAYNNNYISEIILALIYIGVVGLLLDKLMGFVASKVVPADQK